MSRAAKHTSNRPTAKKRTAATKTTGAGTKLTAKTNRNRFRAWLFLPYRRLVSLRSRRPHRSFVRTRRRDYRRSLMLPGYIAFTIEVTRQLLRHKRLFAVLVLTFSILALVLGGLSSAESYNQLADIFSSEETVLGSIAEAGILAALAVTGGSATDVQQLYIVFTVIMTWLTTVWLLREISAGNRPSFRDGLYNAGSPLMATLLVALMMIVQLLPAGLLALAYSALSQTGLIAEGLGAFLFFGVSSLVIALTLYWLTATSFALIIVTLPGMYPWRAMRAASDVVLGRRIRVLLRLAWMCLSVVLFWALVLVPIVLLDQSLRHGFEWYAQVPLISVVVVIISTATTVWVSTYIYTLYRKVVADDAS